MDEPRPHESTPVSEKRIQLDPLEQDPVFRRRAGEIAALARGKVDKFESERGRGSLNGAEVAEQQPSIDQARRALAALKLVKDGSPLTLTQVEDELDYTAEEVAHEHHQWRVEEMMRPGRHLQLYSDFLEFERTLVTEIANAMRDSESESAE